MPVKKRFSEILNDISTAPDQTSWKWKNHLSFLSWALLKIIWVLRLFSLLQLLKLITRYYKQSSGDKKDKIQVQDSKRPDIPPAMPEFYFLSWLLLLILFYCNEHITGPYIHIHLNSFFIYILPVYILCEATIWTLYYTVLRRFFEERYSIYHPLEFLVLIPVVMSVQAIAITFIYQVSLSEAFLALVGLAQTELPVFIQMIGVLYLAIAFSMIINGFPTEKRKSDNDYKIAIIGNGKVVSKIIPGIEHYSGKRNSIKTYTNKTDIKENAYNEFEKRIKEIKAAKVAWIASPSFAHFPYLEKLYASGVFIIMEKPATVIKNELNILKKLETQGHLKNVFFLSYYKLEKALPLTYLLNPSVYYEKYLTIEGDKATLFNHYEELGKISSISVFIIEGKDERSWPYKKENGGQLLETFLHNMVIASQFVGLPSGWGWCEWKSASAGSSPDISTIILNAKAGTTTIQLVMAKNQPPENLYRGAKLIFEHGKILADFDDQSAEITTKTGKKTKIGTKENFKDKYYIQADMAHTCYEDNADPVLIDGYNQQPEIIEWLLSQAQHLHGNDQLDAEIKNILESRSLERSFHKKKQDF